MTEPTLDYLRCPDAGQGHRMAFWRWGKPDASHVVVCVHGLSRQGRDFDVLAQALVSKSDGTVGVVCPDVVGRGRSDWLADPMGYQLATYGADMFALLTQLQPKTIDWVGTSMGGLIGMAVWAHAAAAGVGVRRLVLNDVAPAIEWNSIVRIAAYLGQTMHYASLEQAADAMRDIFSGFGPHTRQQWLELSRHMVKPSADGQGGVTLHYDPAIAVQVRAMTQQTAAQGESALWYMYDRITAATLLLRGAQSDLLSAATALEMTQRGPRARLLEFPDVGHAPTLIAPDQVEAVCNFLLES